MQEEDIVNALTGIQVRMLECQLDISSKADDGVLRLTDQDREALDLSALARSVLGAIPSLEYIRLVVGSSLWQMSTEQSYWEMSEAGGQAILKRISQDDSVAIDAIDRMFIPAEIRVSTRIQLAWTAISDRQASSRTNTANRFCTISLVIASLDI